MNPNELHQQAQQSAAQGQQQYHSDIATSQQAGGQYNAEHAQAGQANQSLQDYSNFMKGAGSATNLYNQGLQSGFTNQGFDPHSLATATQNLTQGQNALYNVNQAAQSSSGGFGLSSAQLGNYYASQSQPIANQMATQNSAVGNMQQLYQNALTQANQYSTVGVQGQQATVQAINQVFQNAKSQSDQSQQQMQYFAELAHKQGALNASETQAYNDALNAYQQSQAAIAQASQAYASAGALRAQAVGYNQANAIGAENANFRMTPDNHGGYNYFYGSQPITREQFAKKTK